MDLFYYLKKTLFLLAMAIAFAGCSSSLDNGDGSDKEKEELPIKGTQWKLVGIADAETSDLKVLEPKDCEECYTLTFITNSVAEAHSINLTQEFDLGLRLNPPKGMTFVCEEMLFSEKYDIDGKNYWDVTDFRCALHLTKSYTVTRDELRLFNGKRYMLFKNAKPQ